MACGFGRSFGNEVVDMISDFTGGKAPSDRAELEFIFTNALESPSPLGGGWKNTSERPLIYLLRKSWHPPYASRTNGGRSSSSSAGGGGPPSAFPPRIDFLKVLHSRHPPPESYVIDPFVPVSESYEHGDEVQYVKTLGSYALSPSASEVALGTALSAVHTLVRREGPQYMAVIVRSRIFGLPEGETCYGVHEEDRKFPQPFFPDFQSLDLWGPELLKKEEEEDEEDEVDDDEEDDDVEKQRVRGLKRSAWALKNKAVQEYTRDMLAKIQLMGDTWVKASMTLGQLDPLPGGPPPPGGIKAKKRPRK